VVLEDNGTSNHQASILLVHSLSFGKLLSRLFDLLGSHLTFNIHREQVNKKCLFYSLAPRLFPPPVFDRLQCAIMEEVVLEDLIFMCGDGRHAWASAQRRISKPFLVLSV